VLWKKRDGSGILVDVGFGIISHSCASQDMGLGGAENECNVICKPSLLGCEVPLLCVKNADDRELGAAEQSFVLKMSMTRLTVLTLSASQRLFSLNLDLSRTVQWACLCGRGKPRELDIPVSML